MIKKIIYDNKKEISTEIANSDPYIIVKVAEDLLYLTSLLRQDSYQVKINELYNLILEKIDHFTSTLTKLNISTEQINEARYLICAAIDETLLSLNNSAKTDYNESLISYYYKEELGGEHFFSILEELYQDVQQKLPLINLAYLLLCLGFEGKYGIKENGQAILREIKEKIRSLIERYNVPTILLDRKSQFQLYNFTKTVKLRVITSMSLVVLIVYMSFLGNLSYQKQQLYELITKPYLE